MQDYSVSIIDKYSWIKGEKYSLCYAGAFGEERPRNIETCDFAMVVSEHEIPVGFVTCIEMDKETLYWQFGGAFDKIKKSIEVINTYRALIYHTQKLGFKRITTRIENTNIAMLRLAMKCGFLITGTWNFKNKIYLELINEFGGEKLCQ